MTFVLSNVRAQDFQCYIILDVMVNNRSLFYMYNVLVYVLDIDKLIFVH